MNTNEIGSILTRMDIEARGSLGKSVDCIVTSYQYMNGRKVTVTVRRDVVSNRKRSNVRSNWKLDGKRIAYAKLVLLLAAITS